MVSRRCRIAAYSAFFFAMITLVQAAKHASSTLKTSKKRCIHTGLRNVSHVAELSRRTMSRNSSRTTSRINSRRPDLLASMIGAAHSDDPGGSAAVTVVVTTQQAMVASDCAAMTVCADAINACGHRYGGCYDVCAVSTGCRIFRSNTHTLMMHKDLLQKYTHPRKFNKIAPRLHKIVLLILGCRPCNSASIASVEARIAGNIAALTARAEPTIVSSYTPTPTVYP